MTREEISELCVTSLAQVLRLKDRIDPKVKFNRLGLGSAVVVYVMMELEEKLDLELTTDDFYDHPNDFRSSRAISSCSPVRFRRKSRVRTA